jgi:hypothetical protein
MDGDVKSGGGLPGHASGCECPGCAECAAVHAAPLEAREPDAAAPYPDEVPTPEAAAALLSRCGKTIGRGGRAGGLCMRAVGHEPPCMGARELQDRAAGGSSAATWGPADDSPRRDAVAAAQQHAAALRGGRLPFSAQRCAVCTHMVSLHEGSVGACRAGESAGARCACTSFNGASHPAVGAPAQPAAAPEPTTAAPPPEAELAPWTPPPPAAVHRIVHHRIAVRAGGDHYIDLVLPADLTPDEKRRLWTIVGTLL